MHTQSKAETYTVEGYNSLFRHFLARLRRKSKCYSKSKKMLKYSVMLLMLSMELTAESYTKLTMPVHHCKLTNTVTLLPYIADRTNYGYNTGILTLF